MTYKSFRRTDEFYRMEEAAYEKGLEHLENMLKGRYSDRKIAVTSILAGLGVVVLILYLAQSL